MVITTRTQYLDAVAVAEDAAERYYQGDTVAMDDASYDAMIRAVRAWEAEHADENIEHTLYAVAAGTGGDGDVVHSEAMYSLDNAMSDADLEAWHDRLVGLLGGETALCVEPKLDGLAVTARYAAGVLVLVATRGDGLAGEDVTERARRAAGLPRTLAEPVDAEIRGEVFMSDDDFTAANILRERDGKNAFVNPRNGAAGALRTASGEYPLSFAAYGATRATLARFGDSHTATMEAIARLGVSTARGLLERNGIDMTGAPGIAAAAKVVAALAAARSTLGFAIDGAVVKADDALACDRAGSAAHAPRWAIAYKYPAEERRTTVLAITLQVGRTGVLTPVAELDPVMVGGASVARATLSNPLEVQRKDIRVGDTVWVRRAGEVIPEIVAPDVAARPAGTEPWPLPTVCPRCDGSLDVSSKRWRCLSARCGQAEALRHFVSRYGLDIEGFGDGVVARCLEAGIVSSPADIFALSVEQLAGLDRMGTTSASKLVARISQARERELSRVLYALGISYTGRKLSATIAAAYADLTAVRGATADELGQLDGIGTVRATAIVDDLAGMGDLLDQLDRLGLGRVNPRFAAGGETVKADGPLTGRVCVITGAIPGMSRDEAGERAAALGASVVSSLSGKVDLVICGDKAGSKRATAEAKGIEILEADAFLAM